MAPTTVFARATIRHNLTELKLRWLDHIKQWKAENRPATESSHDQQFWGDLLDCFGVNARDLYLYQRSAKRASTGRTGKIDMFMPGKVIGEAKSLGVPLDDAHAQALDYLLGGTIANSHMPAYVICSNFETLRVTRLIGQYTKTAKQTADMKQVWGKDYDGYLDYVTSWHAKAKDLLADRSGEFAYVTTNSITQGQPVPALFEPLYRELWRIKFAHRTFAWDSEAPGKAAVHCVIVGFTRDRSKKQRLWDYPSVKGEPVEQPVGQGINAYLVDGPFVLVKKRSKILSPVMQPVSRGSQPTDGGNLVIENDVLENFLADPITAKYIRPFRGSRELMNGLSRWCLWMADDLDPADLEKSKLLSDRILAVRSMRQSSKKKQLKKQQGLPIFFKR